MGEVVKTASQLTLRKDYEVGQKKTVRFPEDEGLTTSTRSFAAGSRIQHQTDTRAFEPTFQRRSSSFPRGFKTLHATPEVGLEIFSFILHGRSTGVPPRLPKKVVTDPDTPHYVFALPCRLCAPLSYGHAASSPMTLLTFPPRHLSSPGNNWKVGRRLPG